MILNRQRTVRVARPPLELFLRRVREQLHLDGADVTICLVSDAEIARMNESFRKKKGPTDVLSFPAVARRKPQPIPRPGSSVVAFAEPKRPPQQRSAALEADFLGDIAISPATARRNAKKYHRTLPGELQILILHGVLHLLGYDHETDGGQMTRIESKLRRKLGLS
jgi:probable rRNA maturation factor